MEDPGREITESLAHYEQLLRVHNDSVSRVQNSVYQVLQRGHELHQVKNKCSKVYISCSRIREEIRRIYYLRENTFDIFGTLFRS